MRGSGGRDDQNDEAGAREGLNGLAELSVAEWRRGDSGDETRQISGVHGRSATGAALADHARQVCLASLY